MKNRLWQQLYPPEKYADKWIKFFDKLDEKYKGNFRFIESLGMGKLYFLKGKQIKCVFEFYDFVIWKYNKKNRESHENFIKNMIVRIKNEK